MTEKEIKRRAKIIEKYQKLSQYIPDDEFTELYPVFKLGMRCMSAILYEAPKLSAERLEGINKILDSKTNFR